MPRGYSNGRLTGAAARSARAAVARRNQRVANGGARSATASRYENLLREGAPRNRALFMARVAGGNVPALNASGRANSARYTNNELARMDAVRRYGGSWGQARRAIGRTTG